MRKREDPKPKKRGMSMRELAQLRPGTIGSSHPLASREAREPARQEAIKATEAELVAKAKEREMNQVEDLTAEEIKEKEAILESIFPAAEADPTPKKPKAPAKKSPPKKKAVRKAPQKPPTASEDEVEG